MSVHSVAFSPDTLGDTLARLPAASGRVVALSGGGDSTALLLALCRLATRVPLRAVHVNHDLHPEAASWADRCRGLCDELGVPLEVVQVAVGDEAGRGLEAASRDARYRALESALGPSEMLLTGHHRDDQAETVLLQLFRGAGPDGLAGMARCRSFGAGWLARPLLNVARADLRQWLEAQGHEWIEDPDNDNLARSRNFLRHRVMPRVERRWPGAGSVVARGADNVREARNALEDWARESLAEALTPAGEGLRLAVLRRLSGAQRAQVMRLWLRDAGLPMPDRAQLAELEAQALGARDDSAVRVHWPGCEIRRHRDVIHAMPPLVQPDPATRLQWDTRDDLDLPAGLGRMRLSVSGGALPAWRLEVGFRQGGERIRLAGREHHTELKTWFQEASVPAWERPRVPLVLDNGELAAVGDWLCSAAFSERLRAAGARLRWDRP